MKNAALWVLQALLGALFLFAGGSKLLLPAELLKGPVVLPVGLLRFVGVFEVLGAVGLVVPRWTRICPGLTPAAAGGLALIMAGATVFTALGGPPSSALIPLTVGVLAALVGLGRRQVAQ